jgi:4-amino-4-deoxy-L-arabinose transferase-like glycosyltransferase
VAAIIKKGARPHTAHVLLLAALAAFALRLALRIARGERDFWTNGYSLFWGLASNFAAGKGLCLAPGQSCALRAPGYPVFLTLSMVSEHRYWLIILLQAGVGAGTCMGAFLIGRELFDRETGIIASWITAIYPYYIWHDTALQDTGLFTFLTALAVFFLLRTRRTGSIVSGVLAGGALGMAVLTRVSLLPFAVLAVFWAGLDATGSARLRWLKASAIALPLCLMVGAWLARNDSVVGAPVLTSEVGQLLWVGNNPSTFSHYPSGSIDLSAMEAWRNLTPSESGQVDRMAGDEVDRWFARKGLAFIRAHPALTLRGALKKVAAGFSWRANPTKGAVLQTGYFLSYVPILILGTAGMLLARRSWREHALIYLLFITFIGSTAVFWAHTSHRSYLDVYLIVFTAHIIRRLSRAMGGGVTSDPNEKCCAGRAQRAVLRQAAS